MYRVPGKQKDIFCFTVSEKSQSKGTAHQHPGFPVMCLSKKQPSGVGSPWHPARVAVCWWRACKRPQTHPHPHAHALGQRAVKVELHALCRVHEVIEQDGVYVTVQTIRDILHLQVCGHPSVGVVLMVPRMVVMVVSVPRVGHTLKVSSGVRLVTGVRSGC